MRDVQMGRDLVQQKDGRAAIPDMGKLPRMRKDDGDQERLLLAGRTLRRVSVGCGGVV